MRIPSQFNDSSLYRPRRGDPANQNRRRFSGSSDTARRLIRLGVALLLVVVVMREARRPGIYETFFGTSSAGWVSTEPTAPGPVTEANLPDQPAVPENQPSPPLIYSSEFVQSLDRSEQQLWMSVLTRIESGTAAGQRLLSEDQTQSWLAWLQEQITADEDAADEDIEQNVRSLSDGSGPLPQWQRIAWWARPLLDALDSAALSRVNDGTFWTGTDSDAFYLQLARSETVSAASTSKTGTLPLLQQPEVYLGQPVRLEGSLQLAKRKQAADNSVGVREYWELWMIPADGGIRPTILMTRELPETLRAGLTKDGGWDRKLDPGNPNGQFVAVGRLIKRLSYRSSIGADLAPVVIGRVIATRSTIDPGTSAAGQPESSGDETPVKSDWRLTGVLAAILAGVALAATLMYRTSLDAKRSRKLRRLAQSSDTIDFDGFQPTNDSSKDEP